MLGGQQGSVDPLLYYIAVACPTCFYAQK